MAQCTANSKRSGVQCKRAAAPGATVCKMHGGGAPQVKAAALRRLALAEAHQELVKLGHPIEVDPSEAVLEMVYESAGNVAVLRRLVQQLRQGFGTAEAPMIRESDDDGNVSERLDPDLDRQWDALGEAGIAGFTGSDKKPNEALPHVFVVMYSEERERLVKWSKTAHDMGIDERRVQLAEQQGRLIAEVLRTALDGFVAELAAAGLEVDVVRRVYRDQVPALMRGALEAASTVNAGGGAG